MTKDEQVVLLADDDENIRMILKDFLLNMGNIKILEASNGLQAVNLLLNEHVDVLILDLYMPKMNGLEVASVIQSNPELKSVSTVMFTTEQNSHTQKKARALGISYYLNKPLEPKTFNQLMRSLLKSQSNKRNKSISSKGDNL